MAVTITPTTLVAVFPEWVKANTDYPAVVQEACDVANAAGFDDLYTNTTEETRRRHLEAADFLYEHPYGRDMRKPDDGSMSPYRRQARAMDNLKGGAERAPGWALPTGAV